MASGVAERRARLEAPAEGVGLDAEPDAGRPEWIDLGLGQEVAGIDEAEPVGLAVRLVGRRSTQREERVLVVARCAARARGGLSAGNEPAFDDVPLPRPCPGQAEQDPVRVGQVHCEAHRTTQVHGRARDVPDGDAPRDHRPVAEDREAQVHLDARRFVGQRDLQGVGLGLVLDVCRGQRLDGRLAGEDAMVAIAQGQRRRAIRPRPRRARAPGSRPSRRSDRPAGPAAPTRFEKPSNGSGPRWRYDRPAGSGPPRCRWPSVPSS